MGRKGLTKEMLTTCSEGAVHSKEVMGLGMFSGNVGVDVGTRGTLDTLQTESGRAEGGGGGRVKVAVTMRPSTMPSTTPAATRAVGLVAMVVRMNMLRAREQPVKDENAVRSGRFFAEKV